MYVKHIKSKKYKLYTFLNDIFEKDVLQYKSELLEYSLKAKLLTKNKKSYFLTDSGILYIKDYIQNFLIFIFTIYSLIIAVLAILGPLNK